MNRLWRPLLVVSLLALACGKSEEIPVIPAEPTPENPVQTGQTSFVSLEPEAGGYGSRGPEMAGGDASANAGAPAPEASAGTTSGAPQGRTGTVEEADIYRVEANRLFYLNTYRGFSIYDLNDPTNPQLLSRLPVYGYPVEMFVTPTTVYALVRDALYLTRGASGLVFQKHNVSQLVSIDITNPASPRVLQTLDIVGELREGVTRKIDNTVYVVSYQSQSYYYPGYPYGTNQTEQAWVYSYNVADPANVVEVERLKIFEGGSNNSSSNTSSSGRYFNSIALSATANTLHVVENWQLYGWTSGGGAAPGPCSTYNNQQQAVVSVIDISNPSGDIRLHSRFETLGQLTDQFKHTYVYDSATQKATYYGIFARQEWTSTSTCQSSSLIRNTLESWDVTDGAHPVKLDALDFGKPNETVRGSAFDLDRQVVYAITAQSMDPLYALSFSNRSDLKVLSAIDGLSGDMNVFRLIGNNDYLIGIGRDNSSACTGFGTPGSPWWSTGVAVSIIDVRNLSSIRLVQRQCVALKDAQWVSSQVNWNLDQAHKMIGMHSDARANVISLPVSYYSKTGPTDWWWYEDKSAVGVMSWDLSRYDSTQDELHQSVLKNHGTVNHPKGQVNRSVIFTHHGATDRRMMLNLSETHLSLFDIDDLDAPVQKAVVEVAPFHQRLFKFGSYIVDEIYEGSAWYTSQGASHFKVRPEGGQLEDNAPVASFTEGRVRQVMQWKNKLVLFRDVDASAYPYGGGSGAVEVVSYDLSNPASPVRSGSTTITGLSSPYVYFMCGMGMMNDGWYWNADAGSNFASDDSGIATLGYRYTGNGYERKLFFIDLTGATPTAAEEVLSAYSYSSNGMPVGWKEPLGLVSDASDGSGFYLSVRESLGPTTWNSAQVSQFRYYAQRYTHAGPALVAGNAINVPGRLVRAWTQGAEQLLLTSDWTYSQVTQTNGYTSWVNEPRLHLLKRVGPGGTLASLEDTHVFTDRYLRDLVLDGDKLYANTTRPYWYYGRYNQAYSQASDELHIFDLSGLTLNQAFQGEIGTYGSQLMGTHDGKLFVNLSGDGILMVDSSPAAGPVGISFLRTLGYATHITFGADTAYVASGNFGIQQLSLSSPPALPIR